ncbi:MAG: hypothetical protein ACQGVC_02295 [Myxococcota bacterium]
MSEAPALSVVVVIASDTTRPRADVRALEGCLQAFAQQQDAPPIEIVVPLHDAVDGVDGLRARFPDVVFLPVDGPKGPSPTGPRVHHHTLRTRGLESCRGALLALAEDHARPDPRWAANLLAAHTAGDVAAVGGAVENAVDRPLQWAVYLCDFAKYMNPLPEGPSSLASDINVAYTREALEAIRPVWRDGFYEVLVNDALRAAGRRIELRRDVVMHQHRQDLRLGDALRERFAWGRSYAAVRSTTLSDRRRRLHAWTTPLLPFLLAARIGALARRRGRLGKFLLALPWLLPLLVAWSLGEGAGYGASGSASP